MSQPEKPIISVAETLQDQGRVIRVTINGPVEVCTEDRFIHVWGGGKEVRIGPLTPHQAERLAENLGYDAVEDLVGVTMTARE